MTKEKIICFAQPRGYGKKYYELMKLINVMNKKRKDQKRKEMKD